MLGDAVAALLGVAIGAAGVVLGLALAAVLIR